jgi:hypothetical protein
MKKFIFLLILAIALVGFLPAAEIAHPPSVNALEAALFGIGIDNYIVTPDTVVVFSSDNAAEQASLQTVVLHDNIKDTQSQILTDFKQPWDANTPDYDLLL